MEDYKYTLGVVIPNWNGELYIGEMLDSIMNQTFTDWQVFVVDDLSTDNSVNIVKAFAEKDSRIHVFIRNRQPKGAQTCRNIGFELTNGAKYVIFLDNDDLISTSCFRNRVEFMDNHNELDFCISPMKSFSEYPFDQLNGIWGCKFTDDSLSDLLNWTLPMVVCTNIYKRDSYVNKNLFWDEHILSLQDSFFNIKAIATGCKYDYLESNLDTLPDYFYRIPLRRNSVSVKILSEDHFQSHIYYFTKIYESLSRKQIISYYKDLTALVYNLCKLMKNNKKAIKDLVSTPFIEEHTVLYIKLFIWNILFRKMRILNILFYSIKNYTSEKNTKWKVFQKDKAYYFRKRYESSSYQTFKEARRN